MVAKLLSSGSQTWYVKLFSFRSVLPPYISGAIPRELGKLTALTWLSLRDNNLSGEALRLAVLYVGSLFVVDIVACSMLA
ncbi:unnamed protein product [Ectocarpus sp. CCAP 1310/34]|nr:unnamed protein product [Ectocarpus sp. CCAP 1310/34]